MVRPIDQEMTAVERQFVILTDLKGWGEGQVYTTSWRPHEGRIKVCHRGKWAGEPWASALMWFL